MRRKAVLGAAAALLLGGAYALGQGREAPVPYRAVVTIELDVGTRRVKEKYFEIPVLTEALNTLHADGYDPHSITPWGEGRVIVVARKR